MQIDDQGPKERIHFVAIHTPAYMLMASVFRLLGVAVGHRFNTPQTNYRWPRALLRFWFLQGVIRLSQSKLAGGGWMPVPQCWQSQNTVMEISQVLETLSQPYGEDRSRSIYFRDAEPVSFGGQFTLSESVEKKDTKLVALVAHDEMKQSLLHFVADHMDFFSKVNVVTTGSTGLALEQSLGLRVMVKAASGPLGGDQEIGALVTRNECGAAFFFIDPLSAHPHEADIQALTRICNVYNVPCATNPSTAAALMYAFGNDKQMCAYLHPGSQREDSHVVEAYKQKHQQELRETALI